MIRKTVSVLLLGVLTVSPTLAQQGGSKAPAQDKKVVVASAPVPARVEFTIAVSGMTQETMAKVKTALTQLSVTNYKCPGCDEVQATGGTCKGCQEKLEERTYAVFKSVTPSMEKSTIVLQLAPEAYVRLSLLERTLRESSVAVLRDKSGLGEHHAFVFEGGTSRDDASNLQKAFRDAKFADAVATMDPQTKEIHVRLEKSGPTLTAATELGSKLAKPLRLTDVIWGQMPTMPKA
jgi:hypothetical protein